MKITNFFAVFVFDRHMQDFKQKTDRVYLTALPASVLLRTSTQTEHYHSADNRLTKCEAFSIFLLVPETHSHTTILTLHSKKQNRSQNSKNLFTRTTT